jgi:hypothetical protein
MKEHIRGWTYSNHTKKQWFLGIINRQRFLIRHGPHRKRHVQQFFYCCVCIRCRVRFLQGPCLETIRIYTDTLTDVRDLCMPFRWVQHSKSLREGYTDTQTAWSSKKPNCTFLNKESELKCKLLKPSVTKSQTKEATSMIWEYIG